MGQNMSPLFTFSFHSCSRDTFKVRHALVITKRTAEDQGSEVHSSNCNLVVKVKERSAFTIDHISANRQDSAITTSQLLNYNETITIVLQYPGIYSAMITC